MVVSPSESILINALLNAESNVLLIGFFIYFFDFI